MACARGCCETSGEHYRSLVIGGPPSAQMQAVKREEADLAAYKRLRAEGHQPPSHVGAAALEKAAFVPYEIESGRLVRNERLAKECQMVHDIAKDPSNFTPIANTA